MEKQDFMKQVLKNNNHCEKKMHQTSKKHTLEWFNPNSNISLTHKLLLPGDHEPQFSAKTQTQDAMGGVEKDIKTVNSGCIPLDNKTTKHEIGMTHVEIELNTHKHRKFYEIDSKSSEGFKEATLIVSNNLCSKNIPTELSTSKQDPKVIIGGTSQKPLDPKIKPNIKLVDSNSDIIDSADPGKHKLQINGQNIILYSKDQSFKISKEAKKTHSFGVSTQLYGVSNVSNKLITDHNTWLYPLTSLKCTPSVLQDKFDLNDELVLRAKAINFLLVVGKMLQLPFITLYTAATYFHRFYMRNSLKKYHQYNTAAICVFLATKVEESNRHLRDVCIALAKVGCKDASKVIDEQSKEYWRWRDCILYGEGVLLENICYDLTLDSPFEYMSYYCETLGIHKIHHICKSAWEFLADSSRTPLCLFFPTTKIVLAALYWSAKTHQTHLEIPLKFQNQKSIVHWVQCFGATNSEIVTVVETFIEWYEMIQKATGLSQNYTKLKNIQDLNL